MNCNGLSDRDLEVLKASFLIYDPVSNSCHQDFTELLGRQVVLTGESHHSHVMYQIQDELFSILKKFDEWQSCCLLCEGKSSNISLRNKDVSHWKAVPPTWPIKGSDVRAVSVDSTTITQYNQLQDKATRTVWKGRQGSEKLLGQIAATLAMGLSNGQVSTQPTNLHVTKSVFEEIERLNTQELQQRSDLLVKVAGLNDRINELPLGNRAGVNGAGLTEPNQGLAWEILETTSEYQKVISIWGEGHYLSGFEIYHALERANISYIVLLPTEEKYLEARYERDWRSGETKQVELEVECSEIDINSESGLCSARHTQKIPNEFVHLFPFYSEPLEKFTRG